MTVGEVGEGVPIGEEEDKPARVDVRTKRRGGRCRWASPRAPSMSPCRMLKMKKRTVKSMPMSK